MYIRYCRDNVCPRNHLSSYRWVNEFSFLISTVLLMSLSKIFVSFLIVNSWATIKDINPESFKIDVLQEKAVLLLNLDKEAFYFKLLI